MTRHLPEWYFHAYYYFPAKQSSHGGVSSEVHTTATVRHMSACAFKNPTISHSLDDKNNRQGLFYVCVKCPSVQHLCDSLIADRLIVDLMCSHIVQANTEHPDKSAKVPPPG